MPVINLGVNIAAPLKTSGCMPSQVRHSSDDPVTCQESPHHVILSDKCSHKTYIMKLTIQKIPFLLSFTIANNFLVDASEDCPSDPGMSPPYFIWPRTMSLTLGWKDRIVAFGVIANVTCTDKENSCCRNWANKVRAQQYIAAHVELRLLTERLLNYPRTDQHNILTKELAESGYRTS